jgi:hypothetical protein
MAEKERALMKLAAFNKRTDLAEVEREREQMVEDRKRSEDALKRAEEAIKVNKCFNF